jgi:hypothetical protein
VEIEAKDQIEASAVEIVEEIKETEKSKIVDFYYCDLNQERGRC